MTDIVERLYRNLDPLCNEAAVEIERLRKALETLAGIFPENHTAAAIARRALEGK